MKHGRAARVGSLRPGRVAAVDGRLRDRGESRRRAAVAVEVRAVQARDGEAVAGSLDGPWTAERGREKGRWKSERANDGGSADGEERESRGPETTGGGERRRRPYEGLSLQHPQAKMGDQRVHEAPRHSWPMLGTGPDPAHSRRIRGFPISSCPDASDASLRARIEIVVGERPVRTYGTVPYRTGRDGLACGA